jgi:hypothetical protein
MSIHRSPAFFRVLSSVPRARSRTFKRPYNHGPMRRSPRLGRAAPDWLGSDFRPMGDTARTRPPGSPHVPGHADAPWSRNCNRMVGAS